MQTMKPGDAVLLWGETGSGKTEVYMRISEDQLLLKKSCLILTPEINIPILLFIVLMIISLIIKKKYFDNGN